MCLRLVGLAALVLALGGIWGSSSWLGGLLFQGGLEQIGTRAGADYGFFLLVANALDLLSYGGLAFAGFGFLTSRGWSRRAGFYVGYYFAVMMPLEVCAEYLSVVRPTLERMRAAGLPAPPAAAVPLHFTGAALMLALAAVLILLGSRRSGRKASLESRKVAR